MDERLDFGLNFGIDISKLEKLSKEILELKKVLNDVIGSKGLDLVVDKLIYEMKDNLVEAGKLEGNEANIAGWINRVNNLRNYLRIN